MAFLAGVAVDLIIGALTAGVIAFSYEWVTKVLIPGLSHIDSFSTVTEMAAAIHSAEDALKNSLSGQQLSSMQMLYSTLNAAVTAGYVKPGQATDAVAFALEIGGGSSANLNDLTAATLTARFKLYSEQRGTTSTGGGGTAVAGPAPGEHSLGTPTNFPATPTIEVTGPAISPHLSPQLAATAGGQLITAAESTLKPQSVSIPGVTPTEAKGITLALAAIYHNAISVEAMALNHVLANIGSIDSSLASLKTEVSTVDGRVTTVDNTLKSTEAALSSEIQGLQGSVDTLAGQITGIDQQVQQIDTAIAGISTGTQPVDLSGIQSQIDGIDQTLPGLATTSQLDTVNSTATQALTEAETIAASLAGIGALGLAATISDLQACCEANSEITGPIRGGGATSGLLGQLGGLLTKATAIFAGLAILDAINQVWDGQLVDLTTAQTATTVAPWVVDEILPTVLVSVADQAQLAGT